MLRFRDEALQREFDRAGFVVHRILEGDQLEGARDAFAAAAEGRSFARNDFEDSYFNSMFEREPGFQGRFRSAMSDIFQPKLGKLLTDFRVFETSLLYKPDHSRELRLHQHVPLTEKPFAPSIFCWCPLVDCDETSGTLMVVPGSHHLLRYLRMLENGEFFEEYRAELTKSSAVPVPVKAGEAVFFENSLIHGAYPNARSSDRPVVLSILMHEDAVHAIYKPDETGQVAVIDNDYTEIQCQTMMPGAPERLAGRVLRHLPYWNEKPTLDEFEELVRRGCRASEEFDPLAELRAERQGRGWRGLAEAILPRIGIRA